MLYLSCSRWFWGFTLPLIGATCQALLLSLASPHCDLGFLAKTKESFKFSDLQYLTARLEAEELSNVYNLTRLVVDEATGSSIFQISVRDSCTSDNCLPWATQPCDDHIQWLPCESLSRCEWIAEVLSEGRSASHLIENIKNDPPQQVSEGWTLDYLQQTSGGQSRRSSNFTSRTLICSIAHTLPCAPALNPDNATDRLVVLETITTTDNSCFELYDHSSSKIDGIGCGTRLYLLKVVFTGTSLSTKDLVARRWADRPFQYSSALNIQVAEQIVATLHHLVLAERRKLQSSHRTMTLWDPTCGSGTILAFAMAQGMRVVGLDSKPKCVEGALQNLEYIFGRDRVQQDATIQCKDSALAFGDLVNGKSEMLNKKFSMKEIDCVVANLPWGVNSIDYVEENKRILRAVRARLSTPIGKNTSGGFGIPCAFVTKDNDCLMFEEAGFHVVGQACIPPQDFELPKARKSGKRSLQGSSEDVRRSTRNLRNTCVVTFVKTK